MTCRARRESDQMVCHSCGLRWDVNDPEPPACGTARASVTADAWRPVKRHELAARLRRAIAMQTKAARDPVSIGISPALALDILSCLEE